MELTEFSSQNSKRFLNPDGSLTEEVHGQSIHYQDAASGLWHEIDTTLVQSNDPAFGFQTKANAMKAYLARSTGAGPTVKVVAGQTEVRLTPLNLVSVPASVRGNQATFSKVMPQTDLKYFFKADSVKELIVLNSQTAVRPSWRFELETGTYGIVESVSTGQLDTESDFYSWLDAATGVNQASGFVLVPPAGKYLDQVAIDAGTEVVETVGKIIVANGRRWVVRLVAGTLVLSAVTPQADMGSESIRSGAGGSGGRFTSTMD